MLLELYCKNFLLWCTTAEHIAIQARPKSRLIEIWSRRVPGVSQLAHNENKICCCFCDWSDKTLFFGDRARASRKSCLSWLKAFHRHLKRSLESQESWVQQSTTTPDSSHLYSTSIELFSNINNKNNNNNCGNLFGTVTGSYCYQGASQTTSNQDKL